MRISDWSSDVCSSDLFQKVALLALEVDMEEGFVDAGSNPLGGDARKAFATELVDQSEIWRERELLDLPVISFGGTLVGYTPYFPKGIDRCHFRRGKFEFPK